MWSLRSPIARNSPGSDPKDQIIRLLEEQNALLRAQLEVTNVVLRKPRNLNPTPQKIRTAADVTVLTRDQILQSEQDAAIAQETARTWTPEEKSPVVSSHPSALGLMPSSDPS